MPAHRSLGHAGYNVLLTPRGGGFSRTPEVSLTRWSGDPLCNSDGFTFFARDRQTGSAWRIASGPNENGSARQWNPGCANFIETTHQWSIRYEVCVPLSATWEIRRLQIRNESTAPRALELWSVVEPILSELAAFDAHPVFSKLFLQTEAVRERSTLLTRRRPRGHDEHFPWLFHAVVGTEPVEFETDRTRFYRRGEQASVPSIVREGLALSGSTGNVLDPLLSFRVRLELEAGETREVSFLLGVAPDRESALSHVESCGTPGKIESAMKRAMSSASESLLKLGVTAQEAMDFEDVAAGALYGLSCLRAPAQGRRPATAASLNQKVHRAPLGVALAVSDERSCSPNAPTSDFAKMQSYWETLGIPMESRVISETTPPDVAAAWLVGAHVTCRTRHGEIAELAQRVRAAKLALDVAAPRSESPSNSGTIRRSTPSSETSSSSRPTPGSSAAIPALLFSNGWGGFEPDGVYRINLAPDLDGTLLLPPLPWCNVLANENFGCLVSERGTITTWSGNSREHRLTPWPNDPHLDPFEEAFYLRDEESGEWGTPFPGPTEPATPCCVRHGFGRTTFEKSWAGIHTFASLAVAETDPIRFVRVTLQNTSAKTRRITLAAYSRLVLGTTPRETRAHLRVDEGNFPRSLRATNSLPGDFSGRIAFAAIVANTELENFRATGDRGTFLGPRNEVARPDALESADPWRSRFGDDLDPCFAQAVTISIAPDEARVITFLLGEATTEAELESLLTQYATQESVETALHDATAFWEEHLSGVTIQTPNPALDLLVNRWLPYQVIACRLFARTAFYQSGGAFGFRDQLQDASSLVLTRPELTRAQLLLHASHQFEEGDVLHWWHPPASKGIRTRFADDLLWLPHLTAHYVSTTGDHEVLDEVVPYIRARTLRPGEDEVFLEPGKSEMSDSLYDHCCRALERGWSLGEHGLPHFGTGDWNDGMNRVGREGRGESVWMGFFLVATLRAFEPLAAARGDHGRVALFRERRAQLALALNSAGWDGDWYRRGYYDDGTPLGSKLNDECRIDALAQAWSVLSGVASADRAHQVLEEVERQLISIPEGIIRLLTPPFQETAHDPGYIKGYVSGVRENGGQYTHAALWVVAAFAELGRNDRVAALLDLLNPIRHTMTREDVLRYRAEPYVIAADVYGAPPHVGRGGWTWYTGSAGWAIRVTLESLLGIRLVDGKTLQFRPCVPHDWPEYAVTLRLPDDRTTYQLRVTNPDRRAHAVVFAHHDGVNVPIDPDDVRIPLVRDGGRHSLEFVLGALTPQEARES